MRILSLICLILSMSFPIAVAAAEKPNLLVILADDLGNGDLGCCGAKDMRTPHLDKLAGEGMQFTRFRANCCVCSPTRAALLTGRYPDLVGVPGVIRDYATNSWGYLDPKAVLLPVPLKVKGYHSAIVGKWHLGLTSPNTPTERGFNFFHGFLGDMMDDYYNHLRHGVNFMRKDKEVIDPKGHATDLFSDWACDYLRKRAEAKSPFCLYLAYNAPHTPIQPPKEWFEKVKNREPDIAEKRAKLVALIEHMDDGIGKVLATLDETGLAKNTLVIFTSDNGGQLNVGANNGDLRGGKQSMYEGGLRVPFFARWPGKIEPGTKSDRESMTIDIFPTLLEAAGTESPRRIEGKSMLPLLCGEHVQATPRDMYFVRREGGLLYHGKTIDAVIRGDWKLLQNTPTSLIELYNLKNDPLETEDLATKNGKVYRELMKVWMKQIQRAGSVPWQAPEETK